MRTSILGTIAIALLFQGICHAQNRTWKGRKGGEIKGSFTGVLQGKVVLKLVGGRRQQLRLNEFSLADRDFLVERLTSRGTKTDLDQLKELIAFENAAQQPIDPDAVRPEFNRFESPDDPSIIEFDPNFPQAPAAQNPPAEVETEMYGLPLPSPKLLRDDTVRNWTLIDGQTALYSFERVLAPGFIRLKRADGFRKDIPMVLLSKADLDHVKTALQKDWDIPIFPAGNEFDSLLPEDIDRGYRVWKDRKGVPLAGGFVGTKVDDVVIDVHGVSREYPLAGLSEEDQKWVETEVQRLAKMAADRAREAAAKSAEERNAPANRFREPDNDNNYVENRPRFNSPSVPFGGTSNTVRDPSLSQPHYVPPVQSQPDPVENSEDKSELNPFASGDSEPKETQGVIMTILYVSMGLAVLAGISIGLIRAFG